MKEDNHELRVHRDPANGAIDVVVLSNELAEDIIAAQPSLASALDRSVGCWLCIRPDEAGLEFIRHVRATL